MRASIFGGRSQIFQSCEVKDREIESIDCVSLYPHVMITNSYPIGQCVLTDKYVEGKIGVSEPTWDNSRRKYQNTYTKVNEHQTTS